MGGKEGSRGYVYQGIIAVLESLTEAGWDKIFVEFPTPGDKVDIALMKGENIVRAIQVKSTDNTFSQGQLKQWVTDIANDYSCSQYELVLIGQCSGTACTFISSIEKFKNDQMDKKAKRSLSDFDKDILARASLSIRTFSNDLDGLQARARDALSHYLENANPPYTFPQINLIVKAMIADQLLKSTCGRYTNRAEFDDDIQTSIAMIARAHIPERISLCLQSFSRGAENIAAKVSQVLDLRDKFNGKTIKPSFDWNADILNPIENFLKDSTNQENAYQIYLEAHSSIAFAAGRFLDSKSGIDISPIQKIGAGGEELWDINIHDGQPQAGWQVTQTIASCDDHDTALIINVTHNINGDALGYIKEQNLPIHRIISCKLGDATNFSIKDGTHAMMLAITIYDALRERSVSERKARLHIFSAAPNAFMFFLGKVSRGFAKSITLYEYDFEQTDTCSYMPSIHYD